jgi:hypothetical protein
MRGDAGAHGSGAEDGNFIDALHHQASEYENVLTTEDTEVHGGFRLNLQW